MASELTRDQRSQLLALAREVIRAELAGDPAPELPTPAGACREPRGAFVTLKKSGDLRGCIGYVEAHEPLWEVVRANARNAAFRDPRFAPLEPDELPDVTIEISVLTPPMPVRDPSEVEVGRDGLIIENGPRRGLLLPQVPVEQRWDRATFLDQACRKAGLEPGCWRRSDTRILRFSADVFGEDDADIPTG